MRLFLYKKPRRQREFQGRKSFDRRFTPDQSIYVNSGSEGLLLNSNKSVSFSKLYSCVLYRLEMNLGDKNRGKLAAELCEMVPAILKAVPGPEHQGPHGSHHEPIWSPAHSKSRRSTRQPSASRCLPAEWQCPSKEGWPPDLNLLVSSLIQVLIEEVRFFWAASGCLILMFLMIFTMFLLSPALFLMSLI